jgi:hypothetical protein
MFARYGSTIAGDTIDVRIDNATTGKLIGKLISKSTGSVTTWITDSSSLVQAGVTGNHNIFVNFRVPVGTNNLNVNWIKFGQGTPVAINTGTANHALPANYSYTRTNKNTFMIVSPAATANASVKLFNASGREVGAVSAKALTQSSIQVNLNAGFMASGAYILSVKNANGSLYSVPFVY